MGMLILSVHEPQRLFYNFRDHKQMSATIPTSQKIHRNEGIVQAQIDGETVMMSIENGEYYGLDTIASRIWELIEKPLTIQELNEQLQNEYDVSPEQCQSDVDKFLGEMVENKIITIAA